MDEFGGAVEVAEAEGDATVAEDTTLAGAYL